MAFIAMVSALAVPVFAQDGVIGGSIVDSDGAGLGAVTVTATSEATDATTSTTSDEEGIYRIPGLAPGPYRVEADLSGFQVTVATQVTVEPGATAEVDFALTPEDAGPRFEIYGHVMTDAGYQTGQNDPDWYDVMRPTKLPAYENEFGKDGETYFSVRQTRFGVQSWLPTKVGEIWGIFEFELFGVGDDAGQTTFRLRHAYFELGQFGAGQYWSPFMDIDVFPNSLEYWGPSGMVFFRNIQVRWMPIKGDTRLTIALERPGASGDQGRFEDRVELDDVSLRTDLPDLSAEYRLGRDWGYVEVAGMLRRIEWDDVGDDEFDLSGAATGWGINLSSNLKIGDSNTVRLQAVYGEGIENYMNDATVDIGIEPNPGNPTAPIKGVPLPILGTVAFLDHTWNDKWTTAIGFSTTDIDTVSGQSPEAFKSGRYALVNALYTPAPNMLCGAEVQYGYRENHSDGWTVDDVKVQFSFKYSFSHTIGGK
jgi:hypothetical protein